MKSSSTHKIGSPDDHSAGFLKSAPDALRYDRLSLDPDDACLKLANLIAPNTRVLDVGCGTGVITDILRHHTSASIIGLEPDAERVERARVRGLEIYQGVLTHSFVEKHGPFDHIVFADVLEHLANPAEIVIIAKSGLKAGGSVVASIPNVAHWFVRTDLLLGRFNYQDFGIMDATHLRWFTRDTIRQFFERLGFQITALDATVNIGLPDYQRRVPWRWMSPTFRRKVVGKLVALHPSLFGCHYIVRAAVPK